MTTPSSVPSKPYAEDATNTIYELLFCDKINLYKRDGSTPADYPWNILFAPAPDPVDLQKLVFDDHMESRVKLLAYDAMRRHGFPVEEKELLGVIVEVGLEEGLA